MNTLDIEISKDIRLQLFSESLSDAIEVKDDALLNGESPYQIKEGCFYEYKISDGYCLQCSEIVSQSKIEGQKSSGRISPNIYVGTLSIDILDKNYNKKVSEIKLEVQSVKTSYRQDYRHMLEDITEKCTDLLLQHNSPVSQFLEVDFNSDSKTLYQRFAFIKSILDSEEFSESVHKILSSPVTRWKESESDKDIRNLRRFNNSALKQIAGTYDRIDLPKVHPLRNCGLESVPSKIRTSYKSETVDTPENRFVKHALSSFVTFIREFRSKVKDYTRLKLESNLLEDKLEEFLSYSIFKEISTPLTLPLNSPVLQRKEGYREILRVWLMFDLAAKLIWHGGDDVYSGDKRDVAILYEYWLFFKLLDLIKEVFKIESDSIENLMESTNDGLGLKLKQGKYLPIKGIFNHDTRNLNIEFSYNKTFSGNSNYPYGGSWTRNLRPDYTLSIWPVGIEQEQAELEELIVHIHFDAKYKIENLKTFFGGDESLEEEKEEQKKGTYKRADILKMHTYRDAIRRTAGAYVLYPGSVSDNKHGFHELLPGLGAFAVRPSRYNDGTKELKEFLNDVVNHFLNRASQREKLSYRIFEIHKDKAINEVHESLPEVYGTNRDLLPDETYILVGYYKSKEQLEWIIKNNLYNFRTGTYKGSLALGQKVVGAKFIVLHGPSETITNKIYKLKATGPKIYSKQDLIDKKYPFDPTGEIYIIYEIEKDVSSDFKNQKWDIKKLKDYSGFWNSSKPITVSLSELMNAVI